MADEEEQLRESLKNHPHLTLDELREFKELFNLVRPTETGNWRSRCWSESTHRAQERLSFAMSLF